MESVRDYSFILFSASPSLPLITPRGLANYLERFCPLFEHFIQLQIKINTIPSMTAGALKRFLFQHVLNIVCIRTVLMRAHSSNVLICALYSTSIYIELVQCEMSFLVYVCNWLRCGGKTWAFVQQMIITFHSWGAYLNRSSNIGNLTEQSPIYPMDRWWYRLKPTVYIFREDMYLLSV